MIVDERAIVKTRPVAAELLHADGRVGGAFHDFAKALNNSYETKICVMAKI